MPAQLRLGLPLEKDSESDRMYQAAHKVDCETMFQAHSISSWYLSKPAPKLSFELSRSAFLTDVLKDATISAPGFLISERVKRLLDSFNIMRHQFFPAPVRTRRSVHGYYWWHLCEPKLTTRLDYERSTFYRTEFGFREEPIVLTSYRQYEKLKKRDKEASFGVELDSIVFSKSFDRTLDVFTFLPFDRAVYCSGQLREALEGGGVSGFSFKKATNFV